MQDSAAPDAGQKAVWEGQVNPECAANLGARGDGLRFTVRNNGTPELLRLIWRPNRERVWDCSSCALARGRSRACGLAPWA